MLNAPKSILTEFRYDIGAFYVPGLIAILLSRLIPEDRSAFNFQLFTFVVLWLLNTGHVYVTLWRTYLRPEELDRSRHVYVLTPLFWFILFMLWIWSNTPYLVQFVFFATIFHNFRQLYGISKWYQKLNGLSSKMSDFFLHALCFLPFAASHFRDHSIFRFSPNAQPDSLSYPNTDLFQATLVLLAVCATAWIVFECRRLYACKDWTRTLTVLFPAILYFYCFVLSQNVTQILFPLVASHGLAYLALNYQTLQHLDPIRFNTKIKTFGIVFSTALILGCFESISRDLFADSNQLLHKIIAAVFLTPLFSHYTYDAFLWRRKHPESASVYKIT